MLSKHERTSERANGRESETEQTRAKQHGTVEHTIVYGRTMLYEFIQHSRQAGRTPEPISYIPCAIRFAAVILHSGAAAAGVQPTEGNHAGCPLHYTTTLY